eukprot:COSAG02_NODE_37521_length_441_cov_0.476608_1_plen_81_part_01
MRWPAPLPDITSPTAPGARSIPPLSHKPGSAINGHALGGVKPPVAAAAVHATAVGTLFFNDTATTEIYTIAYTLSLHDALP